MQPDGIPNFQMFAKFFGAASAVVVGCLGCFAQWSGLHWQAAVFFCV
jgi:hypothetical protein